MTREADVGRALSSGGAPPDLIERLAAYGALVLDVNRTTNLTAARDPESFAAQILDALTLTHDVSGDLIDIGSGAGLPGIPLAIATGRRVTLVDSVKKKAVFLRMALERLGLQGEALDARAESLGRDPLYRERYFSATARAVSTAPTVAELTMPFLAVGGRSLLQRGVMEAGEREALVDAARMLGGELLEERLLGGDRRLLVIVKSRQTQARFPRREGIPEKRPLCV